jgi:hypothetical protein
LTTRGQIVPPGETGVLLNDLDCSGAPAGSDGVTLGRKSSLDLQGHTIIGPAWTNPAQNAAVRCRFGERECHITHGGFLNCRYPKGTCRVFSSAGTALLTGPTTGIHSDSSLQVENVDLRNLGSSIFLNDRGKLIATDVAIEDTGSGIHAMKMTLTNVSVSGTLDFGIYAPKAGAVFGTNVVVNDSARGGIVAGKVRIRNLTATGNGTGSFGADGGGVYADQIKLVDSTVTGNLELGAPADLLAARRPKLVNTVCEHSVDTQSPTDEPWGVCAND